MALLRTLYKYRSYSARTVEQLCLDQMFFADPSAFNDPLDTKPQVINDCGIERLESAVHSMVKSRHAAEMSAAAKTIKYRGPKTLAQIEKLSSKRAENAIEQARYNSTDTDFFDCPKEEAFGILLTQELESELLLQYEKGVVSLAERYDCPLMWSHYGDQHRGICIGYHLPDDETSKLHSVSYGGDRTVSARDVAKMILDKDADARVRVDEAVLLRKARDWRYEKEWRLLGKRGSADSPLDLAEIIFGMRCPDPVKYSVVLAMAARPGKPINFFEIYVHNATFKLKRTKVDIEELRRAYPRRSRDKVDWFKHLPTEPTSE